MKTKRLSMRLSVTTRASDSHNQAVNGRQKRAAFGSLRWRSGAGYLSVKRFMARVSAFLVGIVLAVWFSFTFPVLFPPLLFINVDLEPLFSSCIEMAPRDLCTALVVVSIWLMSLPLNAVILVSGAFAMAVIFARVFKLKLKVWWVLLGNTVFIAAVIAIGNYAEAQLISWHTLSTVITHGLLLALGLQMGARLTSHSSSLRP